VVAGLAVAGRSEAGEQRVNAFQNPAESSGFSLDFGMFGGEASAAITSTQISVAVDRALGTARVVDYFQHVDPLILPGPTGPISTGDITVEILPGSTGTYDALTGQFVTQEIYRIRYTNDLTAFGFTNPDKFVDLPGSAQGTIDIASELDGALHIGWDGASVLHPVPGDPTYDIDFTYSCEVHTTFAPTSTHMLDLALIPFVHSLQADPGVEDMLLPPLNDALQLASRGRSRFAIRPVDQFIDQVENLGSEIDPQDAAAMINAAEGTIYLLRAEAANSAR
jgi:hypothetical protein